MIWAGGNSEKGVLSRTLKNDTKIEFSAEYCLSILKECVDLDQLH